MWEYIALPVLLEMFTHFFGVEVAAQTVTELAQYEGRDIEIEGRLMNVMANDRREFAVFAIPFVVAADSWYRFWCLEESS